MNVITNPCCVLSQSMLVKWAPDLWDLIKDEILLVLFFASRTSPIATTESYHNISASWDRYKMAPYFVDDNFKWRFLEWKSPYCFSFHWSTSMAHVWGAGTWANHDNCARRTHLSTVLPWYVNPFLHAKCFRGNLKHIFTVHVIPPHWYDTGGWNPSSNKTRTNTFHIVNIMAAGVLAMQGGRA